jgi:hypothetical protein
VYVLVSLNLFAYINKLYILLERLFKKLCRLCHWKSPNVSIVIVTVIEVADFSEVQATEVDATVETLNFHS